MPLFTRLREWLRNPLVFSLYVPSVLFATGGGVLGPVLPLYAADFGVPYSVIGLVIAAASVGTLLGDVPAGMLMRRLGKRRVMALGLVLNAVMMVGLFAAPGIGLVFLFQAASGLGWALFGVSRHAYIADAVRVENRGRAIAVFGGTLRIGQFLGPALGGALAAAFGLRVPFLLVGALSGLALLLVLLFAQAEPEPAAGKAGPVASLPLGAMLRAHYRPLLTAGGGQFLAQMTRAGWRTIIPLVGADVLGLDVGQIGVVMSLVSAVDMALFLPAGIIMDRWGRKAAIVPSFALQAAGLALVPLATGFGGLLGAGLLIGFGNGLGAGTMMTVGADLAPEGSRGEFLGVWRLIGDTGAMSGPLIAGAVADTLTLPATALVAAAGGLLAALIFARVVPETLRKTRPVAATSEPAAGA